MSSKKIRFICFHCNSKLEAPINKAGRRGRCPKCKAKNTIPSCHDTLDDKVVTLFEDIDRYEEEQAEKDSLLEDELK